MGASAAAFVKRGSAVTLTASAATLAIWTSPNPANALQNGVHLHPV
jgi:hypothetical protein